MPNEIRCLPIVSCLVGDSPNHSEWGREWTWALAKWVEIETTNRWKQHLPEHLWMWSVTLHNGSYTTLGMLPSDVYAVDLMMIYAVAHGINWWGNADAIRWRRSTLKLPNRHSPSDRRIISWRLLYLWWSLSLDRAFECDWWPSRRMLMIVAMRSNCFHDHWHWSCTMNGLVYCHRSNTSERFSLWLSAFLPHSNPNWMNWCYWQRCVGCCSLYSFRCNWPMDQHWRLPPHFVHYMASHMATNVHCSVHDDHSELTMHSSTYCTHLHSYCCTVDFDENNCRATERKIQNFSCNYYALIVNLCCKLFVIWYDAWINEIVLVKHKWNFFVSDRLQIIEFGMCFQTFGKSSSHCYDWLISHWATAELHCFNTTTKR